jgi:hypothetical protein
MRCKTPAPATIKKIKINISAKHYSMLLAYTSQHDPFTIKNKQPYSLQTVYENDKWDKKMLR